MCARVHVQFIVSEVCMDLDWAVATVHGNEFSAFKKMQGISHLAHEVFLYIYIYIL
jgi:hypothetical protein